MRLCEIFNAEDKSYPRFFFHATPTYRYDPDIAEEIGVWRVPKPIKQIGLIPGTLSNLNEPSIYLTDDQGIARNYASSNLGEEFPVDWVILQVDSRFLNPLSFRPDLDGEAQTVYDDIASEYGYTRDDWRHGRVDWQHVMEFTGQCRYIDAIPALAITPIMTLDSLMRWKPLGNRE